jgi:hypothetical protein
MSKRSTPVELVRDHYRDFKCSFRDRMSKDMRRDYSGPILESFLWNFSHEFQNIAV